MNNQEYQQRLSELLKEKSIAVEKLTRDQLADALLQALKVGDFIRLVTVDERQQVIYIPFAESQKLYFRIAELEAKIKELENR